MALYSAKRRRWILTGIFVGALALRMIAVLLFGYHDIVGYSESGVIARNLVQGKGFVYDFYGTRPHNPLQSFLPPLFPFLIAFCLRYFASPALALELIQAVLSSLTVVFLFLIALRLTSNFRVSMLVAIGAACYPVFIIMSAYPPSLTLNTFVLALFILMSVLLRDRNSLPVAALTGLALGLLILTRPISIGLLPVLLIWLWLNTSGRKLQLLKTTAILAVVAFLTVLPWTVRNYQIHGQLVSVSTNGGFNFWTGNNPFTIGSGHEVYTQKAAEFLKVPYDPKKPEIILLQPYPLPAEVQVQLASLSETELDATLYRAGVDFIRQNPMQWLALLLVKLKGFWWFRTNIGFHYEESWTQYYAVVYGALIALVIPGLILSLRRWRSFMLLYLLLAYYTLTYVAFQVQTRFRWEIEPYLLIFAALTVDRLFVRRRISSASDRDSSPSLRSGQNDILSSNEIPGVTARKWV